MPTSNIPSLISQLRQSLTADSITPGDIADLFTAVFDYVNQYLSQEPDSSKVLYDSSQGSLASGDNVQEAIDSLAQAVASRLSQKQNITDATSQHNALSSRIGRTFAGISVYANSGSYRIVFDYEDGENEAFDVANRATNVSTSVTGLSASNVQSALTELVQKLASASAARYTKDETKREISDALASLDSAVDSIDLSVTTNGGIKISYTTVGGDDDADVIYVPASAISFNRSGTAFSANNVQSALVELLSKIKSADVMINTLISDLNDKAESSDVTEALQTLEEIRKELDKKANSTTVTSQIANLTNIVTTKASANKVDNEFAKVNEELSKKVSSDTFTTEVFNLSQRIDAKAAKAEVQAEIDRINKELAKKQDSAPLSDLLITLRNIADLADEATANANEATAASLSATESSKQATTDAIAAKGALISLLDELDLPTLAEQSKLATSAAERAALVASQAAENANHAAEEASTLTGRVEKNENDIIDLSQQTEGEFSKINKTLYGVVPQFEEYKGLISSTGVWGAGNHVASFYLFPVKSGDKYTIKNGNTKAYYCIIKDFTYTDTYEGNTATFADGFIGSQPISSNAEVEGIVNEGRYLYILKITGSEVDVMPSSILINDEDIFNPESLVASVRGKQDKLTFDTVPIKDSENAITSGAVYNAISREDKDISAEDTNNDLNILSYAIASNGVNEDKLIEDAIGSVEAHNGGNQFLNLLFITDTHQYGAYYDIANSVSNRSIALCNKLSVNDNIDALVHAGDISTDYGATKDGYIAASKRVLKMFHNATLPFYVVKGNHDYNKNEYQEADGDMDFSSNIYYVQTGITQFVRIDEEKYNGQRLFTRDSNNNTSARFITDKEFSKLIPKNDGVVDVNNVDGCYYYKDFASYKVRLIFLNAFPVDDNNNYKNANDVARQFAWLMNTALNILSGWHVAIIQHISPTGLDSVKGYDNIMHSIITAFKNGGTVNYSINGTSYSKTFTGGSFIGLLHGHTHKYEYTNNNGYNDIGFDCAVKDLKYLGTNNAYGLSIVTFDTVNRKIYDTQIGGVGRSFSF